MAVDYLTCAEGAEVGVMLGRRSGKDGVAGFMGELDGIGAYG